MADKKEEHKSYKKELLHFYFAPELRSVATIFYLVIFVYTSVFYLNNVFLAFKFLAYLVTSAKVFSGIGLLFAGLAFFVSLLLPFSTSVYAIFLLHEIWKKSTWSEHLKWVVTAVIMVGSLFIILMTDEASHLAARHPAMQSFIEDSGLIGKI